MTPSASLVAYTSNPNEAADIYLFGGVKSDSSIFSEFRVFSPESRTWSSLQTRDGPPATFGQTATVVGPIMWLFGGFQDSEPPVSDTMWAFNFSTNLWSAQVPTESPTPRFWHTAVFLPNLGEEGVIAIYGGAATFPFNNMVLGDLWFWDVKALTWQQQTLPLLLPRANHAACYSPSSGTMYVYGGFSSSGVLSDLWRFDPTGLVWSEIAAQTASPGPRAGHALISLDGGNLVILVDGVSGLEPQNDVWGFSFGDNTCIDCTPVSHV